MVAGGFDYLIETRVRDMEAYRAFLGDVLVQMPVRETRTYAVLEEIKASAPPCRSDRAARRRRVRRAASPAPTAAL